MAERNNKLILPDFFGSKGGLTTSSSIVNTTDPLQPGETIFEKDTGQFKTNLSSSTLPYSQSGYTGNAIRFSNLAELRGYDYPFDYQLVHTISPKTFFYYDPVDTSSPDDGNTVIVSNNGKRFKAFSPLATIPDNYYVSGSLIVSESITTTETIEKNNIKYWGAVGDGVTDDTVAIQNCLNYNTASLDIRYDNISDLIGGNKVYGESGKTYLISDTLIIPPNVTFDLNNSKLYVTSSHDAVRLKPSSRLENGLIIISSSLDYTDKSAVILLAESSSDNTKADDFFQSIRRPYENTAGISNISFRGPAITEGVTGSLESNCTGDALTLRCISTTGQSSLNIVGTKFENFNIIGFKTGINLEASGSDITPSVVAVNSNQFSNFTIKHTAVGIRLWTNKTPSTEISGAAGEPSSNRAGAVVNQNLFTNWWIQPVSSTRSTYAAIINYGEKNTFDNFTIWDYAYSYPGTEAQGGSPFLDSTPLIYTPNGTLLNSNTDGISIPSPAAIVDLNPNGSNVYNGGFNLYNVLDKSYLGANQYNSTNFSDFRMLSITNHNTSLPSYHKYGLPIGDQNDYLAFAWERGFGISQSRYPDSFTGSRYDNISQSISTVFEPYGNGFVTYNSITTPVELTISFNQQEFNSYIREFSKLSSTDYYFRSDNRFFKGVGLQFKKQKDISTNTFYQTPEHVKISVIQRNRTGGFSSENTIYEYNKNKNLYIGGVGKEAFEASSNGGFWDVKVLFSSSAEQDNPVALERISAWLGTDDNKAYIKRSDDYYYGGLEFKPVYGRNSDGTIDTTTPIRSASLHVSGSISMDNFILTSPNGSKYRFTTTDDGYLSITGSAL